MLKADYLSLRSFQRTKPCSFEKMTVAVEIADLKGSDSGNNIDNIHSLVFHNETSSSSGNSSSSSGNGSIVGCGAVSSPKKLAKSISRDNQRSASRSSSSCTTASYHSDHSLFLAESGHDLSLERCDSPVVIKDRFGVTNRRPSCVNLLNLDDADGYTTASSATSSRSAAWGHESSGEDSTGFGHFVDTHDDSAAESSAMFEILAPLDDSAAASPNKQSQSVLHFEECVNGNSLHRTFHFGHSMTDTLSSYASVSSRRASDSSSSSSLTPSIHVVMAITASRCVKRSFLSGPVVEYELTISFNERQIKLWKSYDDFVQVYQRYTQYYSDKDYSAFSSFFTSSRSSATNRSASSSANSSPRRRAYPCDESRGCVSPAAAAFGRGQSDELWNAADEDIDSLWCLVKNYHQKFPLLKSQRHVRKFGQYLEVFMRFILFESPHLASLLFLLNIKDQVCLLVD